MKPNPEHLLKECEKSRKQAGQVIDMLRAELDKAGRLLKENEDLIARTQVAAAAAYWKAKITSFEEGQKVIAEYVEHVKAKKAAATPDAPKENVIVLENFLGAKPSITGNQAESSE